ncbi:MAG: 3-deoxy-D-manno-octulosonic acid transferase [Mariprofundus sp.]|nr:3-deoxy-D-manno-octulosonic acid transferase [Mariprofundus sp.]
MHQSSFTSSTKWRQQFGLDLPPSRPGCIWLHACSVGEVSSVAPLIRALLMQGHNIHLTVVTATGFSHAQRLLADHIPNPVSSAPISSPAIAVAFLPWDLPTAMSRMIKQLQPALLLLAETEFWPGMLSACRRMNIPVIGINTRISDRSFPRYLASRWLWRRWLAPVHLFLAQSDVDRDRLIALGIPADHIKATGNLKYAINAPDVDTTSLRQQLDGSGTRPILLIASTHEGEDASLLKMWPSWHAACPQLLMVLVPRHPQRFDQVAELIHQHGLTCSRWSMSDIDNNNNDVILIDAMGLLGDLYSIADVAILAGSLQNIGGHNPLEAAICGRGVVTGPHIQNFREIMHEMQQHEAAIVCQDDDELEAAITRLLKQPDELKQLNANAALFIEDRSHVLERMLTAIEPWLPDLSNT